MEEEENVIKFILAICGVVNHFEIVLIDDVMMRHWNDSEFEKQYSKYSIS
jgi:hypothetical protein